VTYPPVPGPVVRAPALATTSLVLGILAVTVGLCLWFFPVLPVLAVVFGHVSLRQIHTTQLPGRGRALTGVITGYCGIGVSLVLLALALFGTFTTPSLPA
jgi:hypothetical protein